MIQLRVDLGDVVASSVLVFMLLPLGQLCMKFGQARITGQDEVGRRLLGFGHVLLHLGHAPAAGHEEFAFVFVQLTREQGKKTGFASSVAAHKARFFARLNDGAAVLQQDFRGATQRDVFQRNHKRGSTPLRQRRGDTRLVVGLQAAVAIFHLASLNADGMVAKRPAALLGHAAQMRQKHFSLASFPRPSGPTGGWRRRGRR